MIEPVIGEVFEFEGENLVAVKVTDSDFSCDDCHLGHKNCFEINCMNSSREDGEYIIIKKAEENPDACVENE